MSPTFAIITGPEIAIIVGIAVLLFGADRIPKLARSMGEAKREFEAAQRTPPPPPPGDPSGPQPQAQSQSPPPQPPPAAPPPQA
jgi:TatA/E family protein of Tat protein translocase